MFTFLCGIFSNYISNAYDFPSEQEVEILSTGSVAKYIVGAQSTPIDRQVSTVHPRINIASNGTHYHSPAQPNPACTIPHRMATLSREKNQERWLSAAKYGDFPAIRTLIDSGMGCALANVANLEGTTALIFSILNDHHEMLSALLGISTINVNATDRCRVTPLLAATYFEREKIIDRLLKVIAIDVNAADLEGDTALIQAAFSGNHHSVNALLNMPGIKFNTTDKSGGSALKWAASRGHCRIVMALLNIPGIRVNTTDNDGDTALIEAASAGHVDVVRALLQVPDIDIHVINKMHETALSRAKTKQRETIVELLLNMPERNG